MGEALSLTILSPDSYRVVPQRPFVGREAEMSLLSAALEQACAGHGGVALLVGEPGIGKTCTAEELAAQATQQSAQVCWAATEDIVPFAEERPPHDVQCLLRPGGD